MNDKVISKAKKYALKQGKSLSGIVENYLISITASDDVETEPSPKIQKLKGVITLSKEFDYKKSLSEALYKKYSK